LTRFWSFYNTLFEWYFSIVFWHNFWHRFWSIFHVWVLSFLLIFDCRLLWVFLVMTSFALVLFLLSLLEVEIAKLPWRECTFSSSFGMLIFVWLFWNCCLSLSVILKIHSSTDFLLVYFSFLELLSSFSSFAYVLFLFHLVYKFITTHFINKYILKKNTIAVTVDIIKFNPEPMSRE
jgi:hypothetical protein